MSTPNVASRTAADSAQARRRRVKMKPQPLLFILEAPFRRSGRLSRPIMASNMLKLMRSLGFAIKPFPEDPDFRLVTHVL